MTWLDRYSSQHGSLRASLTSPGRSFFTMDGNTIEIDTKNFPALKTRQALLIIDCQNDFLGESAPVRVTEPEGLVGNLIRLANAFRAKGDVIWIRTEFEKKKGYRDDEIWLSNTSQKPPQRGRARSRNQQHVEATDPEAFLDVENLRDGLCVRKGTEGADYLEEIKSAMNPVRDRSFTKTSYSAFSSSQVLNQLRARLVTELYLGGSLLNIGVFATAVDASRHGYQITLVDDCCGHRNLMRCAWAKKKVADLTGCSIVNLKDAIKAMNPAGGHDGRNELEQLDGDSSIEAAEGGKAKEKEGAREVESKPLEAESEFSASEMEGGRVDGVGMVLPPMSLAQAHDAKDAEDDSHDALATSLQQLKIADGGDATSKVHPKMSPGYKATQPQATASTSSFDERLYLSPARKSQDEPSRFADHDSQRWGAAPDAGSRRVANLPARRKGKSHEDGEIGEDEPSSFSNCNRNPNDKRDAKMSEVQAAACSKPSRKGQDSSSEKSKAPIHKSAGNEAAQKLDKLSPGDSTKTRNPKSDNEISKMESFCEDDTTIIHNLLPAHLEDGIFEKLKSEVDWAKMSHQGGEVPRLVAVQGEVDEEGNKPVYRHPSDESPPLHPFIPAVRVIKEEVEKHLKHELNHVLIQWYRDGHDYISEHSDKTLDISPKSFIASVSIGAQRTMVLRTKRRGRKKKDGSDGTEREIHSDGHGARRQVVRVPLPHNSLLKMGLRTNMRWLHGIRQDKRVGQDKTEAELAYNGCRISLTFRRIGTYIDRTSKLIWGQGATGKTKEDAHQVVNGQTPETVQMLKAFGAENHETEFNWGAYYGGGFDVLHMHNAARLFTCPDATVNHRVQIMLAELGITYARGSMSSHAGKYDASAPGDSLPPLPTGTPIMFIDNDDTRAVVEDEMAIMLYLDQVYGQGIRKATRSNSQLAQQLQRFYHSFHLARWWRETCRRDRNKNTRVGKLKKALTKFEAYLKPQPGCAFLCGDEISIADFAFWPTLHEIVRDEPASMSVLSVLPKLKAYHERFGSREATVNVLGDMREQRAQHPKTFSEKTSTMVAVHGDETGATRDGKSNDGS